MYVNCLRTERSNTFYRKSELAEIVISAPMQINSELLYLRKQS